MRSPALPLAWIAAAAMAAAATPAGTEACFECHAEAGMEASFADGTALPITIDPQGYAASAHGAKACTDCHADVNLDDHPAKTLTDLKSYRRSMAATCARCHGEVASRFATDVHAGTPGLACTDCHDVHRVAKGGPPRKDVPAGCGGCHEGVVAEYGKSSHGAGLTKGNPDVPTCADCHQAHAIAAAGPELRLASVDLCRRCHGDATKMARYGLSTAVLTSYLDDFHGVSVTYRKKDGIPARRIEATCIDCHGAHAIPRRETADSLAIAANAAKTCQRCHPGATESFSKAWLSHYIPSPTRAPLPYFVRLGYLVFIPVVILGMLAHVGLDLARIKRLKAHGAAPSSERTYTRFTPLRRAEHALVILVFTALCVTGLPQKFHDAAWGERMILAMGGIELVRFIHRVAGYLFAAEALFHLGWNLPQILLGRMRPDMLLGRQDFRDALIVVKGSLGLTSERARFDRYDFRQKFEYWGIVFGGMLMIVTGLVLIFPTEFASLLPGQLIPAAKVAHSFEAMMAFLVIIVWHFYCAHLSPEVFPVDKSIFTGRISHHRMVEEHPAELARIEAYEKGADPPPPEGGKPPDRPA